MRSSVTIHRLAPSEESRRTDWANALASFDTATAKPFKVDGPDGVWRATILGLDVVLKRHTLHGDWARLKSLFRVSRSFRQWTGAERLLQHRDLRTARPIVLAAQWKQGSPDPCEWIATEFVPGPTVLSLFAQGDFTPRLARALGRQLTILTNHGLFNRDHKPSNLIIVDPKETDLSLIHIVDTVAIRWFPNTSWRFGRPPHLIWASRMLASLIIEPTGCGHPPPESFVRAVADHYGAMNSEEAAWLTRTALRIRAEHGDPTPRVNPLA